MLQCQGNTQKKVRCKIMTPGLFCQYHAPKMTGAFFTNTKPQQVPRGSRRLIQSGVKSSIDSTKDSSHENSSSKVDTRKQYSARAQKSCVLSAPHIGVFEVMRPSECRLDRPGHIYLYTFLHLLELNKNSELGLYIINNCASKIKGSVQPVPYAPNKMEFIFLKVGMTTQRVSTRIRQWKEKCRNEVTLISPFNDNYTNLKDRSLMGKLVRNFSLLSVLEYSTYDKHQGAFKCNKDVARVEREVHDILGKIFGCVNFQCLGCSIDGNYKQHVEWFCVPKSKLRKVYRLIDQQCKRY